MKLVVSALAVAAFVVLGAVQLAGAAGLHPEKPNAGKLTMTSTLPFRGKINTTDEACESKRPIRIVNAANQSLITDTRSSRGSASRPAKWSKQMTFVGEAYAIAPRGDGCGQLRSNTVLFSPPINPTPAPGFQTADLAITKVSSFHDGNNGAQYTITVTNNGPNQANGVVVTDDPNETFIAMGSDTRCGPDGAAVFTCNLGSISPGVQVSVFVKVGCFNGNSTTNTASVAASTADPNLANNATGSVVNNPC